MRIATQMIASFMLTFAAMPAAAQDPTPVPRALTFQQWKDQQVLEAQNQVLRSSSRLAQLKAGKAAKPSEPTDLPTSKLKKVTDAETIATAELDLRRAQEYQESAARLVFEDYIEVYVPTLHDQPEALQKLSERLSKEELTEILKVLMRKSPQGNPDDAKRNSALAEGLAASARNKSQ